MRRVAELQVAEATESLNAVTLEEAECSAICRAWDLVETLVRRGKAAEAIASAELVIGEKENAAKPALNALNVAARALRRALMAAIETATDAADAERQLAESVEQKIAATESRYRDCLKASAAARARVDDRTTRITDVRDAIRRAHDSGLVASGMAVTEALASCSDEHATAAAALESAVKLHEELDERCRQAERAQAATAAAVNIAEQQHRAAVEQLTRAEDRTEQLAELARLAELLDVDTIDVDNDAEVLVQLLDEAPARGGAETARPPGE